MNGVIQRALFAFPLTIVTFCADYYFSPSDRQPAEINVSYAATENSSEKTGLSDDEVREKLASMRATSDINHSYVSGKNVCTVDKRHLKNLLDLLVELKNRTQPNPPQSEGWLKDYKTEHQEYLTCLEDFGKVVKDYVDLLEQYTQLQKTCTKK